MRLLIVEDDPDGRELMAELFRLHDWSVTAVPTTVDALALLRRGGFDVVISDENLEGESGSKMLRAACREGLLASVGVVMYTAEDHKLDLPAGARVLHKPLGTGQLVHEAEIAAEQALPPPSGVRVAPRAS